jgi:hypothetical protein
MARIQIDIPHESLCQLMQLAALERRSTRAEAEVLLIKAIADYYAPVLRPESLDEEVVGIGGGEPQPAR